MKKHKIFFLVALLLASSALFFSAEHFGWHQTASVGSSKATRSVAEVNMFGNGSAYSSNDGGAFSDEYLERNVQDHADCRVSIEISEDLNFSIDELLAAHEELTKSEERNLYRVAGMTDAEIETNFPVSEEPEGYKAHEVELLKMYKKCISERPIVAETAADQTEGVRYPWWEELSPRLTLSLERKYDVFILINTQVQRTEPSIPAATGATYLDLLNFSFSSNNLGPLKIPRQHIKIVVRKRGADNDIKNDIFIRDQDGKITDINTDNTVTNLGSLASLRFPFSAELHGDYLSIRESWPTNSLDYLIPTTTGIAGNGGMKTVNGIFNMNYRRSLVRRGLAGYRENNAPMSHPIYIKTYYRDGQESGIAVHGTPPQNRRRLGVVRGSHGCARVHIDHAQAFSDWIFSLERRSVPNLTWKTYEPFNSDHNTNNWIGSEEETLPPVLFVIFNGYKE